MYKVACIACGKTSFTAVRIKWLTNPFCPYCGGKLKQNEIQDNNPIVEERQTFLADPS